MANNFEKGALAEEHARNLLVKIFNGRAQKFTGEEDKGIDLTIQFTSPFTKSIVNIGVQVKSGRSYIGGETNKHWKFKYNNTEQLDKIKRYSLLPVILVWVDLDTSKSFWTVLTSNSSANSILISKKNELSPLTLYDFLHKYYKINYKENQSNGFLMRKLSQPLRSKYGLIETGKLHYKNLKNTFLGANSGKIGIYQSPTVGGISITNHGWRAMTRDGRKKAFITNSIELILDLDKILEFPSKLIKIYPLLISIRGKYIYHNRRLILRLANVKGTPSPCDIIIVLSEQIVFDSNWKDNLLFYFETKRNLCFENIYEKKRTTL